MKKKAIIAYFGAAFLACFFCRHPHAGIEEKKSRALPVSTVAGHAADKCADYTPNTVSAEHVVYNKYEALPGETQDQFVWEFLRVAVNNVLLWENTTQPWRSVSLLRPNNLKYMAPDAADWLSVISSRARDPKGDGIVKWTRPVKISVGWPVYGKGNFILDWEKDKEKREFLFTVSEAAKLVIPAVKENTGINIEFVDPRSTDENTDQFARIRIIPLKENLQGNKYKFASFDPWQITEQRYGMDPYFAGAVPFTPYERAQVDGFILPNSSGEIEFAACKIRPDLDVKTTQALVSECIVRAVGLTGVSPSAGSGLLGKWNAEADKDSMTFLEDGLCGRSFRTFKDKSRPSSLGPPRVPSDIDRKMLSTLYCPSIKPGMNKVQVIQTITDGSCQRHQG